MRTNLFVILFCLMTSWSFAQTKMSNEPVKFIKELENFVSINSIEAKEFKNDFIPMWETQMTAEDKKEFIEFTNLLLSKKIRPLPDYKDFVSIYTAKLNSEIPMDEYTTWKPWFEQAIERFNKRSQVQDLLRFSNIWLRYDQIEKAINESYYWALYTTDYTLGFRDKKPVLEVGDDAVLKCVKLDKDSLALHETEGYYNIMDRTWKGNKGKFYWSRLKLPKTEIWASFKTYTVKTKLKELIADSVDFYNKKFFDHALTGSFQERLIADNLKESPSFPRFISYNEVEIQNLVEDVNYQGGFTQLGGRFIGSGTSLRPAKFVFYREGNVFMDVMSENFSINLNENKPEEVEEGRGNRRKKTTKSRKKTNRIVSSRAKTVIYLEQDSIVHPGLKFAFYTDDREVQLLRSDEGMAQSPYFNSYHQLAMKFELMSWKMKEPLIKFSSMEMSTDRKMTFESLAYFRVRDYDRIKGINKANPLEVINIAADEWGTTHLTDTLLADYFPFPITQLQPTLLRLSYLGYLNYDVNTGGVILYPKVKHQVLSKRKKTDFDVIRIESGSNGEKALGGEAVLSLLDNNLTIKQVNDVILSDVHRVTIYPQDQTLVVKKNRDMSFSGQISAGKADFYGKTFEFSYENFKIDMPVVDAAQLWVIADKRGAGGEFLETNLSSLIETLSGELKIDVANNKSGIKEIPQYPIFSSFNDSYVYYDSKHIQNSRYPKDKVYFQLDPFRIDSLDKYNNAGVIFPGTFVSGGIFPDLKKELVVMEDYSLGFESTETALPAYGGKGNYTSTLTLSNKGLKGDGTINYQSSYAYSEDFTFYPDSTEGITHSFNIEEEQAPVESPDVVADTTFLSWKPYRDTMDISTIPEKNDIYIYKGANQMRGTLYYTPSGLAGSGENAFYDGVLTSKLFTYKRTQLLSDTADFKLAEGQLFETLDFSSNNVSAVVDFEKEKGDFELNDEGSVTTFDVCQYQSYLDRFTYVFNKDEVEFSSSGGEVVQGADSLSFDGAKFISIHPKQDSLSFFAKAAVYSISQKTITAKEVELIPVADANIYPKESPVIIRKKAEMDPLVDAKIEANSKMKYHSVEPAEVKITGRWKYTGNGSYDYTDENDMVQTIFFEKIWVDTTKQTRGTGEITEEMNFALSPHFLYQGKMNLLASEPDLNFNGFVKLPHECDNVPRTWFKVDSYINPKDIQITVDEDVFNIDKAKVISGLTISSDSTYLYGAFMSRPLVTRDWAVNDATGVLTFDKNMQSYIVGTEEKRLDNSLPENLVQFSNKDCTVSGNGELKLALNTGDVDLRSYGKYTFNSINADLQMEAISLLNFLFPKKALEVLAEDIKNSPLAQDGTENEDIFEMAIGGLLKKKNANDYLSKRAIGKSTKIPSELEGGILFNNLDFKYVKDENKIISKGGMISIGNIYKNEVNVKVPGGILMKKYKANTQIEIFIQTSGKNWYSFKYVRKSKGVGMMTVKTSNPDFELAYKEAKNDEKKTKIYGTTCALQAGSRNRTKSFYVEEFGL